MLNFRLLKHHSPPLFHPAAIFGREFQQLCLKYRKILKKLFFIKIFKKLENLKITVRQGQNAPKFAQIPLPKITVVLCTTLGVLASKYVARTLEYVQNPLVNLYMGLKPLLLLGHGPESTVQGQKEI